MPAALGPSRLRLPGTPTPTLCCLQLPQAHEGLLAPLISVAATDCVCPGSPPSARTEWQSNRAARRRTLLLWSQTQFFWGPTADEPERLCCIRGPPGPRLWVWSALPRHPNLLHICAHSALLGTMVCVMLGPLSSVSLLAIHSWSPRRAGTTVRLPLAIGSVSCLSPGRELPRTGTCWS